METLDFTESSKELRPDAIHALVDRLLAEADARAFSVMNEIYKEVHEIPN